MVSVVSDTCASCAVEARAKAQQKREGGRAHAWAESHSEQVL